MSAQDKITLGLVAAACVAYLGDVYVKRAKIAEDGQKIVDAMHTEQEHLKPEQPGRPSVQRNEVEEILLSALPSSRSVVIDRHAVRLRKTFVLLLLLCNLQLRPFATVLLLLKDVRSSRS